MSIPNIISIMRLLAVPLIVWLILRGYMTWAFWLFLGAAVSDALDGIIAKRFDAETQLGGYLDPLADKALLVATYVTLGHQGYLPVWLVILVVFRDLLIIGGAILYHTITRSLEMAPLMISKVNTVAQIVLVVAVLAEQGLALNIAPATRVLCFAIAATTFASGAVYVVTWSRQAAEMEPEAPPRDQPSDDRKDAP